MKKHIATAWLCGLFFSQVAFAIPYLPIAEDELLEKLPIRLESRREIKELRQQMADNPAAPEAAFSLVKRYIEMGRAESDPSYYGYAEAALAPWLLADNPLPEALTLSATLHQGRHEFPAALADLSQALARQPRLAQAWLTRAVIFEVQGDYPAALKNCMPLAKLAPPLTAAVCVNSALSLSGQAESAYQRLALALQSMPEGSCWRRRWRLDIRRPVRVCWMRWPTAVWKTSVLRFWRSASGVFHHEAGLAGASILVAVDAACPCPQTQRQLFELKMGRQRRAGTVGHRIAGSGLRHRAGWERR